MADIVTSATFVVNISKKALPILLVIPLEPPRVVRELIIPAKDKLVHHVGDFADIRSTLIGFC